MAKSRYDEASGQVVTGRVALDGLKLQGFERVEHVPKASYRDNSMCIIVPTREPWLHSKWVERFNGLMYPMNGKRAVFFVSGAEVGKAYSEQIAAILAHPDLSRWKYVLTIEDDNFPPPDGVIRLLESIEEGPFDAVSGLYFTRGDFNMPMIYGNPAEYARTGLLEFRPQDPTPYLANGGRVVPCNGIANGFSLYRTQLFRDVPAPWFVTYSDVVEGGAKAYTQDLAFCEKAIRMGKKFAVDCRVRVGHYDYATETMY